MVEGGSAGGYSGPSIADNTIELSAGRVSPNAVGLNMEDCDGVQINTGGNSITLSDAAMVISNCDVAGRRFFAPRRRNLHPLTESTLMMQTVTF